MALLFPLLANQAASNRCQNHHTIQSWNQSSNARIDWIGTIQLGYCYVEDEKVKTWGEVGVYEGQAGEHHWDVQSDEWTVEVVRRLRYVEVVVFPHVDECEQTAVYPTTTLGLQVFVVFHWVCVRHGVRHVP